MITGGASGLGRGTAEYLYRVGAKIVILDIPQSGGSKVAESLGENAIFTPADVSFLFLVLFILCFRLLMKSKYKMLYKQ